MLSRSMHISRSLNAARRAGRTSTHNTMNVNIMNRSSIKKNEPLKMNIMNSTRKRLEPASIKPSLSASQALAFNLYGTGDNTNMHEVLLCNSCNNHDSGRALGAIGTPMFSQTKVQFSTYPNKPNLFTSNNDNEVEFYDVTTLSMQNNGIMKRSNENNIKNIETFDQIMSRLSTAAQKMVNDVEKKINSNPGGNNYRHYHRNKYGYNNNHMMMNHCRSFSTNSDPSTDNNINSKNDSTTRTSKSAAQPKTSTTKPETAAPAPAASSTPSRTPQTLKKDPTIQEKTKAMIRSMVSTIATFFAKIPGVLWFYITHPTEFKEKLIELKEIAKKEAHHYYMGSKLLIADIKTARQMLGRLLQGSTLTRRERKQFIRTVTDVFRVIPFSIFVLIPFMEFALPLALRIFPNMLPSTFQDSLKHEENMKRELKSRIAMAEFFQETLQDLVKDQKKAAAKKKETMKAAQGDEASTCQTELKSTESREETAASFLEFIEKARKGEFLPPEVIIRYSAFFKDELTLDNMPRMQLINMCKYMSIPPYGNDHFLRFQLRHKIRVLQEDDQRILWEGIDSLTKMELREACQERGMRSTGLSKEAYMTSLQQWIDLSVNRNVPIALLIMSRTFFLREEMTSRSSLDTDGSKSVAGLADAISGLDKEVVNEVILENVRADEKKSDPELTRLKLEVLEHQNELIQEENEQREAEKTKKTEAVKQEQKEENEVDMDVVDKKMIQRMDESKPLEKQKPEVLEIKHTEIKSKDDSVHEKKEEDDKTLSSEEIDAISQLVSPDPVSAERQKLEEIKAAMQDEVEEPETITMTVEETETGADVAPAVDISMDSKETPVELFASEQDIIASEQMTKMEESLKIEAESSTIISMDDQGKESRALLKEEEEEVDYTDQKLEKAISRLKSKVESMVGNIEIQLSTVEEKIGDKFHLLDKDMDGILSREEMAICLQSVLKRPLTFDEAMAIANDMDENEDGYFSIEELQKWLATNKLVKLVEEGRDAEVDKIIALHAKNAKDSDQKEAKDSTLS